MPPRRSTQRRCPTALTSEEADGGTAGCRGGGVRRAWARCPRRAADHAHAPRAGSVRGAAPLPRRRRARCQSVVRRRAHPRAATAVRDGAPPRLHAGRRPRRDGESGRRISGRLQVQHPKYSTNPSQSSSLVAWVRVCWHQACAGSSVSNLEQQSASAVQGEVGSDGDAPPSASSPARGSLLAPPAPPVRGSGTAVPSTSTGGRFPRGPRSRKNKRMLREVRSPGERGDGARGGAIAWRTPRAGRAVDHAEGAE